MPSRKKPTTAGRSKSIEAAQTQAANKRKRSEDPEFEAGPSNQRDTNAPKDAERPTQRIRTENAVDAYPGRIITDGAESAAAKKSALVALESAEARIKAVTQTQCNDSIEARLHGVEDIFKRIDERLSKTDKIGEQVANLHDWIQTAVPPLQKMQKLVNATQMTVKDIQISNWDCHEAIAGVRGTVSEVQKTVNDVEATLVDTAESVDELQETVNDVQEKANDTLKTVNKMQETINDVQEKADDTNDTVNSMTGTIDNMHENVLDIQENFESVQETINSVEETVGNLQMTLNDMQWTVADLRSYSNDMLARIADLEALVREKEPYQPGAVHIHQHH